MRVDIYQNNAIVNNMKYIIDLLSKKIRKKIENNLQLFLVVVHHLRL